MIYTDSATPTGIVTLQLFNFHGDIIKQHTVKNLVVTTGLQFIAARMGETNRPTQMTHMAVGTNATAANLTNDQLLTQQGNRVPLTTAGGTVSGAQRTYNSVFGVGISTGALVEAGIFNAATGGTMLCRTTFPVINKGANDTLAITWVITVS